MAMPTKVDYNELKRLFITEGKSYRELSRMFPISHSVIAERGRKEDWPGQRMAYQSAIARRAYEGAAEEIGYAQVQIHRENVAVARAYIRRFAEQLAAGTVNANAKDAVEFIKLLAVELNPAKGEGMKDGPTVIDGHTVPVGDAEQLRRLVEMARQRVSAPGVLGADPLGEPANPRAD